MNTLTRQPEELTPGPSGGIGIYVCGVTPYAEAHVGHAMSLLVYDVLARYLRWPGNSAGGYPVTFVSNYTDIDDKLIDRGVELGRDPLALADQQIDRWEREQAELGIADPDVRPRVTSEIDTITQAIGQICDRGYGYVTPAGDVYFRVRASQHYGKLSHRDIEQLRSGTRGEPGEGKEFPLDFALWKAARPGEPSWPAPWGRGRPGWHIECSAMAQRYLGDTFEIHGGGVDLIFPHHENEVAQAEAATGAQFARIWMHNGMVLYEGEKMSKSLGNVVTVEEALSRWSAAALRLFVLNSAYRGPNNLTAEAMAAASRGLERLTGALDAASGSGEPVDIGETRRRFIAAMEDDLGTPAALAALFDLARTINRGRDVGRRVTAAQATLGELASVLGLRLASATEGTTTLDAVALSQLASSLGVTCGGSDVRATIEALIDYRAAARSERDFARADEVRERLAALAVDLEDTSDGTRWSTRA